MLNKKILGVLFFSIFTAVTGVGIVVPLLPVYAHSMGASGFLIGMIFGAFSMSRTVFLPFFGRLSDRKGRKPMIATGLISYALISVAFIFSNTVHGLILVRFIQGIASAMMMPVALAYVGDITPAGSEGTTMGLFNISMFFGLSLGPVIGGVINDRFNLDGAFIAMGILSLVGFMLSLFWLPPTRTEHVLQNKTAPAPWRKIIVDRVIASLFVFRFAYAACIGIIWGFLPVLADTVFSLSSLAIGVLVMLGVFISGLIHYPMGALADRVNKKIMVISGGLLVCAALLYYEWASGFNDLLCATSCFGIGGGIAMPALMALAVQKGNQVEAMGSVMSLITLAHSLGMLLGALLAGLMMDMFELSYSFPLGAGLMLLATLAFSLCTISKRQKPAEQR